MTNRMRPSLDGPADRGGGRGKSSEAPGFPTRAPLIRRFFCRSARFLGPAEGVSGLRPLKILSENNGLSEMDEQSSVKNPELFVDLLGDVRDAGLPVKSGCCAECGAAFEQRQARGRPMVFCSDPCRAAAKARQTRAGGLLPKHDRSKPITCGCCGKDFLPIAGAKGRLPLWCSYRCRIVGRSGGKISTEVRDDLFSEKVQL